MEFALVLVWTWSKHGISRSGIGAWIYWDESTAEIILAPLKYGSKISIGIQQGILFKDSMEDFQLEFGGVDMDRTAEMITRLSILPIQFSVGFPNINERSINGFSANYWQLLAATNSWTVLVAGFGI